MKSRLFVAMLLTGIASLCLAGCAFISHGTTQTVVIRTLPAGAKTSIDDVYVGVTPLKVTLSRKRPHKILVDKAGFYTGAAVLLPLGTAYEKRLLRWGIDYDLGANAELTPGQVDLSLSAALVQVPAAERYAEMGYRVLQADALLADGQISRVDHHYLVTQITDYYTRP